jgi:putative serine protease PepD
VTVVQVQPGSPAATAGLKAGDEIIAVDGESVNSSESLVAQIRERAVGDSVTLTLVRDGKHLDVTAKLTARASQ